MNILLIMLLSQFVLMEGGMVLTRPASEIHHSLRYGCTVPQSNNSSIPPEYLRIHFKHRCRVIHRVNLKQAKRVLANENLPIWILSGLVDLTVLKNRDVYELQRNYEVMKQLGKFTFYHDSTTSSAAIYFHERDEFDGMIDYEFLIRKLSIERNCRLKNSFPLYVPGIYRRPDYLKQHNNLIITDSTSGVNDQKQRRTYRDHVYEGYPEVLVIVSVDVTEFWTQRIPEADHYITVVSNVLTLFNGVDMLFSKLKQTKIQINIAGIIIGVDEESFIFLKNCYYSDLISNRSYINFLDGGCVNKCFRHYLSARKKIIPTDSYDLVIFLTKQEIFQVKNKKVIGAERVFMPVLGISSVMHDLYENRMRDIETILVGTISILNHMGSFPLIAHEMAHLMTLLHDLPPFYMRNGKCCAGIMKSMGDFCDRCLSWSEISEQTFRFFFSSINCCGFINEPRSLYSPGRYQLTTADAQCRCYGYKSAREYEQRFHRFCDYYLVCIGDDDEFYHTVVPMDGTPCGDNKVCYQRICQDITIFG